MNYSLSIPVIVIVIEALDEELLALLIVVVTSLLGLPVSATEMRVSFRPSRTDTNIRTANMIKKTGLFTSTSSQ